MWLTSFLLTVLCVGLSYGCLYDIYTGKRVSEDLLEHYEKNHVKETCTINIKPCDKNEWRRVDGSCNNLKNPARGTFFAPMTRILPATYSDGFKPRKCESGEDLPLERKVRLNLLKHKKSSHKLWNSLVPGFGLFAYLDWGSIHDTVNMLGETTYCCEAEHMNDDKCAPNIISADDPVFRSKDIRCLNGTRPLTYQTFKCTQDKVPSPIKKATTAVDLSQVYNAMNKGDKVLRTFKGGELAVEEENGELFPPNGPTASCPSNVQPSETRCFENYFGVILPIALLTTWFVRYHNLIASNLAELNPCWDDERLFQTARDINIAFYSQVYYYEWNTVLQGRKNLIKAGVITKDNGFRDIYDDSGSPEVTLEFQFIYRWFHLRQESITRLPDAHGNFVEEFKVIDTLFRTGVLANNMSMFTQSMLRTPCHGGSGTVDYEMANFAFEGFQRAVDATASDINKNRNFGLPPYVDYIRHFMGIEINSFEDLKTAGLMTKRGINLLESTYDYVDVVDLLAGVWCEKNMKGGNMPLTAANIMNDNMRKAIKYDRHSYEQKDRPHAFNEKQLKEIRSSTLAGLICSVAGDGIKEIPKNAFYNISPKNPLVPCEKIKKINFEAWADPACKKINHSDNSHVKKC